MELTDYYQYRKLDDNENGDIVKDIAVGNIPHGSYEMRVVFVGKVSGISIESNEIIYKLIRYDSTVG
jgi:hypothetical protein